MNIPFGSAHLPSAQVADGTDLLTSPGNSRAFVEEAQRWLPDVSRDGDTGTFLAPRDTVLYSESTVTDKATVLLVDDDRDMRDYVTRVLTPRFAVVAAEDGAHALDLLDTGVIPDLVLSDVMMPRLDGIGLLKALRGRAPTQTTPGMPHLTGHEVAEALRREPWGARIVLIALTGWGQEGDRQRALKAGFDQHRTKPVDPDTLEALVWNDVTWREQQYRRATATHSAWRNGR